MAEQYFDRTHMTLDIFPKDGGTRVHTWWLEKTKTSNQILSKHLSFKFKFVSVTLDRKSRKQQDKESCLDKKKVLRQVFKAPSFILRFTSLTVCDQGMTHLKREFILCWGLPFESQMLGFVIYFLYRISLILYSSST